MAWECHSTSFSSVQSMLDRAPATSGAPVIARDPVETDETRSPGYPSVTGEPLGNALLMGGENADAERPVRLQRRQRARRTPDADKQAWRFDRQRTHRGRRQPGARISVPGRHDTDAGREISHGAAEFVRGRLDIDCRRCGQRGAHDCQAPSLFRSAICESQLRITGNTGICRTADRLRPQHALLRKFFEQFRVARADGLFPEGGKSLLGLAVEIALWHRRISGGLATQKAPDIPAVFAHQGIRRCIRGVPGGTGTGCFRRRTKMSTSPAVDRVRMPVAIGSQFVFRQFVPARMRNAGTATGRPR